jgi:hypothetical protein
MSNSTCEVVDLFLERVEAVVKQCAVDEDLRNCPTTRKFGLELFHRDVLGKRNKLVY